MDKRATPRIEVNTVATAQLLGDSPDANGQINPAMIVDVSERGIRLRSPVRMKPGQAVKVEIADVMFLCEVCYCTQEEGCADTSFHMGATIHECLSSLNSLQHLIRALAPETVKELERLR